jgi:hypothetical protein
MTAWLPELRRAGSAAALLLAVFVSVLAPAPGESSSARADEAEAHRLAPYSARYAIYRNGKLTGRMDLSLERHGERWILSSEGSGTHGLARILAARDIENVEGRVLEGRFRPDRYHRHTRVAGIAPSAAELLLDALVAAVDVVDAVDHGLAPRATRPASTRRGRGAQVGGHHRRAGQLRTPRMIAELPSTRMSAPSRCSS